MTVPAPTLTGRRVTLRPYVAGFLDEELARMRGWARDAEILALSGGTPIDLPAERFRELFLAQLPRRNSGREQQFAILDEAGALIGRTGLFGMTADAPTAELGIVIGERRCWGRGYGREAVDLLLGFAFESLALHRVYLYTYPDNARARRAFESVGFRAVRDVGRFSLDRGSHRVVEMAVSPASRGRRHPRVGGAA